MAENESVQEKHNVEIEEVHDIEESDTTDWKAEALKFQGIAKRNATKLEKLKQAPAPTKVEAPVTEPNIKNSFDYGEMAYLEAKGITDEEYPIVLEAMKATGKSLRDTVASKYVMAELKEIREAKASKEALPTGSKRSTSSPRNEVDYWIAKGELPPDNPELSRKVTKRKLELARGAQGMFTDRPIV